MCRAALFHTPRHPLLLSHSIHNLPSQLRVPILSLSHDQISSLFLAQNFPLPCNDDFTICRYGLTVSRPTLRPFDPPLPPLPGHILIGSTCRSSNSQLTIVLSRFYRNPEEIDAENAAAAKLDRATAQRRSAIRREPTIRPRRDQSSFTSLSNIIRSRHEMQQIHSRLHRDNVEADAQIAQLEAELQSLRRQRERTISRMERHRAQLESESARPSQRSPESHDTTTSNDPTLTQQDSLPDAETHSQVLLPRPARESNLRFEMAATASTRPASPQQDASTIPSPPRSLNESGRSRPVDGPIDAWDAVPPLSQDFAPARAARAARAAQEAATGRVGRTPYTIREIVIEAPDDERPGLETPPPETWENSYPPLRRVPHMSPRPLPRTPVDGLGDRRRSPSPYSEPREESTWNNLMSTMDTSNHASSTSTSFASMTDLLSASRSSSYRSSNTQSTSTSFGEIGSSSDETCDLPPGITEDDVRVIRERHGRTARRPVRRRFVEREYGDREHIVDSYPYLAGPGSTGGSESAMSRLLMDHVAQRLQQNGEQPRNDAFHDILERMQRREHIPDDLWAVVGLSPDYFSRS